MLFDGCVEAVPQRAITLGLWEILEAAEIHLVVTGAAKAGILKRLLDLRADPAARQLAADPSQCLALVRCSGPSLNSREQRR